VLIRDLLAGCLIGSASVCTRSKYTFEKGHSRKRGFLSSSPELNNAQVATVNALN